MIKLIYKILPKKINPYYLRWRAKREAAIRELEREQVSERWFKALGMLFEACEPLTYDSKLSAQQIKERHQNIVKRTFYCAHVKNCIEDGVEPLSWEDWLDTNKRMRFEGDAFTEKMEKLEPTTKLEPINIREFQDDLVRAFGEDYREYPSKTPKKKNTGFIARYSNK